MSRNFLVELEYPELHLGPLFEGFRLVFAGWLFTQHWLKGLTGCLLRTLLE